MSNPDSSHSLIVGMGYLEDGWFSSQFMAEKHFEILSKYHAHREYFANPLLFTPHCTGRPNWIKRRLLYARKIPKGKLFHLVDPSYADSLLSVRSRFDKIVLTVTDLAFWKTRNLLNQYFRKRIARGVGLADALIAISNFTADETTRVLGYRRPYVVHPGVDTNAFPYSSAPRDPNLLLHVGSTIERKGLDRIFRLLHCLPERYRLLQLGGSFTLAQQKLIDSLGLQMRVNQIPSVSLTQLRIHYQKAAALVFPSRYEGYGFPCIEARLCGTPVVHSPNVPAAEALQGDPGCHEIKGTSLDAVSVEAHAVAKELTQFWGLSIPVPNREYFDWKRATNEIVQVYDQLYAESPPIKEAV